MNKVQLQLFRVGLGEILAGYCSADGALFAKRLIFKIIALNVADSI
jgi:hypothetical protein